MVQVRMLTFEVAHGWVDGQTRGEKTMCAACVEYTKDKLNIKEFSSALGEMAIEDQAHVDKVRQILETYGNKPEELKKEIEKLTSYRVGG